MLWTEADVREQFDTLPKTEIVDVVVRSRSRACIAGPAGSAALRACRAARSASNRSAPPRDRSRDRGCTSVPQWGQVIGSPLQVPDQRDASRGPVV